MGAAACSWTSTSMPGCRWGKSGRNATYREIALSDVVIVLSTPDWHASKWCWAEFTHARALGKEILPVVERASGQRVASNLQELNLTADRADGLEYADSH